MTPDEIIEWLVNNMKPQRVPGRVKIQLREILVNRIKAQQDNIATVLQEETV